MKMKAKLQWYLKLFVALFFLVDLSLLVVYFQFADQERRADQLFNLLHQQAFASQTLTKEVLHFNWQGHNSGTTQRVQNAATALDEAVANLLKKKPKALFMFSDHNQDPLFQSLVTQTQDYWSPLKGRLASTETLSNPEFINELFQASHSLNELTQQMMNRLTVLADQRNTLLMVSQVTLFASSILFFVVIVVSFYNRLRESINVRVQLENLVDNLSEAILIVNSRGKITNANAACQELLHSPRDQLVGHSFNRWLVNSSGQFRLVHNEETAIQVTQTRLADNVLLITIKDITEKKLLKDQADHDALTGLYNRNALEEMTARRFHNSDTICCLFLDLDKFKPINDQYGHKAGDRVLQIVAHRLRTGLKSQDIVARVGGDEFLVLLAMPDHDHDLHHLCTRLATSICQPIAVGETEVSVGVSIGVSLGSHSDDSLETLIAQADKAMYKAKRSPSSAPEFFI